MREWLILGVVALGGILGIWLLIFKSLAALYELWQSGREFDRLKRDAASRRMQRPSELMQKKSAPVVDTESNTPVIPQALLDSLSDEAADPLMVPRKRSATHSAQPMLPPAEEPNVRALSLPPADPQTPPPASPSPPSTPTPPPKEYDPSTTTSMQPEFPLPPPADDDLILDADREPTNPPADSPATPPPADDDASQRPPRYDE